MVKSNRELNTTLETGLKIITSLGVVVSFLFHIDENSEGSDENS
jgi:uncharacterized membrane protein